MLFPLHYLVGIAGNQRAERICRYETAVVVVGVVKTVFRPYVQTFYRICAQIEITHCPVAFEVICLHLRKPYRVVLGSSVNALRTGPVAVKVIYRDVRLHSKGL